jgi:alpha-ketoglutarate-dependent taurine dioxygenase
VITEFFNGVESLPLVIRPSESNQELTPWASENRDFLENELLKHGGILFRGFRPQAPAELEAFIRAVSSEPLPYHERSSPRHQVEGNIYTSTDHPPNQEIFLHNENSYQSMWPMKIFFLSVEEAEVGGETPIADCRKILRDIDPRIRETFQARGFRIVRNYNTGMGLRWQTVFNSDEPAYVDTYCAAHGLKAEWLPNGVLRTTTLRGNPIAVHPKTGEETWFNHGTFFHVTSLGKEMSDTLLACLPKESLPTNTYYGDGEDIELDVLEHLRSIYRKHTVKFLWQHGDVLMLDNMFSAHGRSSCKGKRKVVVGMSEPMTREQL